MCLPLIRPQLGTWPATQACAMTGNQTDDLFVLRLALKSRSHTSQAYFIKKKFLNLFLEREKRREKERERNINVRETAIGCLSHTPQPRTGPTTQTCALIVTPASDLSFCGMMLNQLSHAGQGKKCIYFSSKGKGVRK